MIINISLALSPSLNINRSSQGMIFECMLYEIESNVPLKHTFAYFSSITCVTLLKDELMTS